MGRDGMGRVCKGSWNGLSYEIVKIEIFESGKIEKNGNLWEWEGPRMGREASWKLQWTKLRIAAA